MNRINRFPSPNTTHPQYKPADSELEVFRFCRTLDTFFYVLKLITPKSTAIRASAPDINHDENKAQRSHENTPRTSGSNGNCNNAELWPMTTLYLGKHRGEPTTGRANRSDTSNDANKPQKSDGSTPGTFYKAAPSGFNEIRIKDYKELWVLVTARIQKYIRESRTGRPNTADTINDENKQQNTPGAFDEATPSGSNKNCSNADDERWVMINPRLEELFDDGPEDEIPCIVWNVRLPEPDGDESSPWARFPDENILLLKKGRSCRPSNM